MTSLNGTDTNYSSLGGFRLYLDPSFNEGKELLSNKTLSEKKTPTNYKTFLEFHSISFKKDADITIFIPKDISKIPSSISPVDIANYHSLPFLLFTSQFKGRKIKVFTKFKPHYFFMSYVGDHPYVFDEQSNVIKIIEEGNISKNMRYYVIERDMRSISI